MQSWTFIERRSGSALPYYGVERRSHRTDSGPRTEEPVLIERAIARDHEAFARLYDRYIDRIFKYIHLLVGEQALAEDLATQVFVRAWQTLSAFPHSERPFALWLYRLANDVVKGYGQTRPPAQAAASGRAGGTLPEALSRLDEGQKRVLLLRFLEGYNVDQIAQITGQSPATVRSLQYRALVRLSATSRAP